MVAAAEIVLNPVRLEADTLFEFDMDEFTADGTRLLNDLLGNLTATGLQEQKIGLPVTQTVSVERIIIRASRNAAPLRCATTRYQKVCCPMT